MLYSWFDTCCFAAVTSGLIGVAFGVGRGAGLFVFCADAVKTRVSKIQKTVKNLVILINIPACSIYAKHFIIRICGVWKFDALVGLLT